MKMVVFSARRYDRKYLEPLAVQQGIEVTFVEARLTQQSVVMAKEFDIVCPFVNDLLDRETLRSLSEFGVRLIALRCAGFNNVDIQAATDFGIPVVRVPSYSPHSVAEHTFALILSLNRRVPKAFNRVREGNFELNGLLGFDLYGKTLGVIGVGNIGRTVTEIANGFGMRVLACDPYLTESEPNFQLVELEELLRQSDIVTLHCPLTPETQHLIDSEKIALMKRGAYLINTSRGGLIDTHAIIQGLKQERLGGLGIDVYENEADLFFEDKSHEILEDQFARLITFPNVIVTGHQGFFTEEALREIAQTTIESICSVRDGNELVHAVQLPAAIRVGAGDND